MSRNLSVSTILTWKIPKIQIGCSKLQNKAHFCNLWEKQMQIDTHFNDFINDVTDNDHNGKTLDKVLGPR